MTSAPAVPAQPSPSVRQSGAVLSAAGLLCWPSMPPDCRQPRPVESSTEMRARPRAAGASAMAGWVTYLTDSADEAVVLATSRPAGLFEHEVVLKGVLIRAEGPCGSALLKRMMMADDRGPGDTT